MAQRLFSLLLFSIANVALCAELLSYNGTCQRPEVIAWPENLLAREEDQVVELRCFTACSGEVATLESNRTQSELDRCVGGCLLQYRNAVLSVESCRSACVNDSSCITGCDAFAKYFRMQRSESLSNNPECPFVPVVGSLSIGEQVYISRGASCLLYTCQVTAQGPAALPFELNCSALHTALQSCLPSLSPVQLRLANCCGFCSVPGSPDSPLALSLLEESSMDAEYRVVIPEQVLVNASGSAVGYLLKIEDNVENVTRFFSMRTRISSVSLFPFACREVSVSYAAVNRFGQSGYSPATDIHVYVPAELSHSPQNIQVLLIEEDRRVGFLRHAIVTISWELPQGYDSVRYYEITLESSDRRSICNPQDTYSMQVDKNQTNFKIMANSTSLASPPLYDCTYTLTISSNPGGANTTEFQVKHSGPRLQMILMCEAVFDSATATYNITGMFSVPPLISESIIGFDAKLTQLLSDTPIPVDIEHLRVSATENRTEYRVVFPGTQILREKEGRFALNINPIAPGRTSPFFWRRPISPKDRECELNTPPVAPTAMQNISFANLSFFETTNRVEFVVNWLPPMFPNGVLELFELRVGLEEIAPSDDEIINSRTFRRNSIRPMQREFTVRAVFPSLSTPESEGILYLQMRSRNNFLFSNWSQPVLLNISEGIEASAPMNTTVRSDTLPVFAYVLFGIAGLLLLATITVPIMVCCHRSCFHRRMKFDALIPTKDPSYHANGRQLPPFVPFLSDEWEIPRDELKIFDKEPLGKGCFGEVHKGLLAGQSTRRPPLGRSRFSLACTVAVKKLKRIASSSEKASFLKEIDMMKKVSGTGSDLSMFVVNMVGCCTLQEPLLLVLEYVKHGDLLTYLRSVRRQATAGSYFSPQEAAPYLEPNGVYSELSPKDDSYMDLGVLEERNLLEFARQIAAGMEFLAGLDIVHRDLACRNILIGEKKNMKISDFGMSRLVPADEVYVPTSHGLLPLRWMAVESIFHREFTSSSDSWSYGVALWEICTMGGFPYPSLTNRELTSFLKRGYRMGKPDNCSPEVYEIMLRCWSEDTEERPTFAELHKIFDQFLSSHIQDHYPYIELQMNPPYSFDNLEPEEPAMQMSNDCPVDLDLDNHDPTDIAIIPAGQQPQNRNSHTLQVPAGSRLSMLSAQLRNSSPDVRVEADRISRLSVDAPETRYVESPIGASQTNALPASSLSIQDDLIAHLERKLSNLGGNTPKDDQCDRSDVQAQSSECQNSGTVLSESLPSSPPKILAVSVPEVMYQNGDLRASDQEDINTQLRVVFRETDV